MNPSDRTPQSNNNGLLKLEGACIPYTVTESPRAKYIRLQFKKSDQLEVIVPKRMGQKSLERVLNDHKEWICEKWRALQLDFGQAIMPVFLPGGWVYFQGKRAPLYVERTDGKEGAIYDDGVLRIACRDEFEQSIRKIVLLWLQSQAKIILANRLMDKAHAIGASVKKVTIKDASARWGSCSARSNINLNWRLIMMPLEISDYVMIHELMHLQQMNHSRAFWSLVGNHYRNYESARRWLKMNRMLLAIGR